MAILLSILNSFGMYIKFPPQSHSGLRTSGLALPEVLLYILMLSLKKLGLGQFLQRVSLARGGMRKGLKDF